MSSGSSSGRSLATGESIRVNCEACGAKFKLPATKAGKRGPCPKCGQPIIVPRPAPAAEVLPGDVDWSMLADAVGEAPKPATDAAYELAGEAAGSRQAHRPVAAATLSPRVAEVAPDPVLAAAAGGSFAGPSLAGLTPEQRAALARRAEERASAGRGPKVKDGDDQLFGFPSFLMGLTLSVAGAAIGAALWFGLLAGTGRELRFLAIFVGVLAGGGMAMGYQKHDVGAGFLAACLAVGAIIFAKFAVAWWGTGYLIQATVKNEVTELYKEVDRQLEMEYTRRIAEEEAGGGALAWLKEEYVLKNNMDWSQFAGMWDWQLAQHFQPMEKQVYRMVYDDRLNLFYRWEVYTRQRAQRQKEIALGWDQEQAAAKAAEAATSAESGEVTTVESSGQPPAGEGMDEDSAERDEYYDEEDVYGEAATWRWSQEKRDALAPRFREAEVPLFAEIGEMQKDDVKGQWEAYRQQEYEREKDRLKQERDAARAASGQIVAGDSSDPGVVAAQQAMATYIVFGFHDLFFLPLALAAAWKIGSGFGD